jgi:hypothetical protein
MAGGGKSAREKGGHPTRPVHLLGERRQPKGGRVGRHAWRRLVVDRKEAARRPLEEKRLERGGR